MSELATSESLQKLDQRHTELLEKLDALCQEIEATLASLAPKSEPPAEEQLAAAA